MSELNERIKSSMERIAWMCAHGKPPRMSIPANKEDDDLYIIETLRAVEVELSRLRDALIQLRKDFLGACDWPDVCDPNGSEGYEMANKALSGHVVKETSDE